MNPVHVLVGDDPRAEAMWSAAFGGSIDLYRFATNIDAFGRLAAAEAPVDLVVLTPAQHGPFNLTAEQFVTRIFESALGTSAALGGLHIIVVGEQLERTHSRIASVRTLDAAIRLVKFGEIEQPRHAPVAAAPAPQAMAPRTEPRAPRSGEYSPVAPSNGSSTSDRLEHISSGIISRIWDAVDRAAHADDIDVDVERAHDARITGGGATPAAAPAYEPRTTGPALAQGPKQLFTRATSTGFMVNPQPVASYAPTPEPQPLPGVQVGGMPQQVVMGGGYAQAPIAQIGAPGESIEVATGQLLPARQFQLTDGAGYRGPSTRGGVPQASSHLAMSGGQPVPPALASQVQSMIYGGAQAADPLLSWSGNQHGAIVTAGVPVPAAQPAPSAQPLAPSATTAAPMRVASVAPMPAAQRHVPMQPPSGVYGSVTGNVPQTAATPLANPQFAQDPFLARAEAGGGDVSFG